ncbi:MAG: hypothetical protein R3E39_23885 [Anaerolineae bacterium]
MPSRPRRRPSALTKAAGVAELTRRERWSRLQFRQHAPTPTTAEGKAAPTPYPFTPLDEGNGIFGQWTVDETGLPAYDYTLDQYADARAVYPNSEHLDRRDHWHQIGNERITGLASNDGTVQVYLGDRGGVFLNKFEAWDSARRGGGLLGFLARIVLEIARFLARLRSQPNPELPQPYAAAIAAAKGQKIRLSQNPRATLRPEHVQNLREEASDTLLQSYQALAEQGDVTEKPRTEPNAAATHYAYAGGYGYVDDGEKVWATAYRYRPKGAEVSRRFGMGYFETDMQYRELVIRRRVYAPAGNDPLLLADVWIENQGTKAVDLKYYEYWDVNVHQLRVEWLRSGAFGAVNDEERRQLNRQFTNSINYREQEQLLEFRQDPPPDAPPPDQPSPINWYPSPIFLADVNGQPDGYYINKATFFGAGGAREPDTVRKHSGDEPFHPNSPLEPMPFCMVLRRDIHLEGGQRRKLRFAYGAAWPEERREALAKWREGEPFVDTGTYWYDKTITFWTGQDPLLHREMAWHSYNFLSATTYNSFHKVHVVPQGSAYLYLHGADGAPRDQAMFALTMTYLNPPLAKDMLKLMMQLADRQSGQIPYAFTGHGYVSNALNVHTHPSDLDLYFLLAMGEYLIATRDFDFLKEELPYYPPDKAIHATGYTVIDHIRFAIKHLFELVGIGDHNLLRVRTGDWSDSITLETALSDGLLGIAYQNSKAHGESVPNSQMALYVLPLLAEVLKWFAPDIPEMIYDGRLKKLREGVEAQWNATGWYNRAVLRGLNNEPAPVTGLSLEAQVWALISGVAADAGHEPKLLQTIQTLLDDPSPLGATLVPNGAVWPAQSQLLTWAYARVGLSTLAWRSLYRNTFAMHARQFPATWYGIWSGPDGMDGISGRNPGQTWGSVLTPMTDFPVMNANPDAMALFGLLRTCGIEPAPKGNGLIIRPRVPRKRFVLDTTLLYLEVDEKGVRGEYRAHYNGNIALFIYKPGSDKPIPVPLTLSAGQRIPFAV